MKVSVVTITYNHEPFIAQALDSILMQQAEFDFEVVIGEDCSTDHTRDIVIEYQKRYPDKIRLLLHDQNLGANRNFVRTLQTCQGQYIAILEGDDYWTSSDKLQKQVCFLDSHPECVISFHNVIQFYESDNRESHCFCPNDQKEFSTLEDLLLKDFIPNCSVMFRNGLIEEFPDWFYTLSIGDWPIHLFNAQYGKIGYINEVMGAYRVHNNGVWSSLSKVRWLQADIEMLGLINARLDFRYENIIRTAVSNRWGSLAAIAFEEGLKQNCGQAAIDKVMEMFNRWTIVTQPSIMLRTESLGKIYAGLFFASHKARDFAKIRYFLARMVKYDRSWLCNVGVWSIGTEAFLGKQVAGVLRRAIKKLSPT